MKRESGGGFNAGTMDLKYSSAFTDFLLEDTASWVDCRVTEPGLRIGVAKSLFPTVIWENLVSDYRVNGTLSVSWIYDHNHLRSTSPRLNWPLWLATFPHEISKVARSRDLFW